MVGTGHVNRHVIIGASPDIDLCDDHHAEMCKKLHADYCYAVCVTLSEGCTMCITNKSIKDLKEHFASTMVKIDR